MENRLSRYNRNRRNRNRKFIKKNKTHNGHFTFTPFRVEEIKSPKKSRSRDGEWPIARSGHCVVWGDNNMYLIGGYNPAVTDQVFIDASGEPVWDSQNPIFKELFSWNPDSNTWRRITVGDIPRQLASSSACFYRNALTLFGGTGFPFGENCGNSLWILRMSDSEKRMKRLPDVRGTIPPPHYGQCAFFHENYFYKIGGTCGYFYNCDIHRLNLETLEWEVLFENVNGDDEPFGRYRHEVAFHDDKIFVLGGGTKDETFGFGRVPIFDLKSKTWSIASTESDPKVRTNAGLPRPRKFFSSIGISFAGFHYAYIFGGLDFFDVRMDVWRLNLVDLRWTRMEMTSLPVPSFFHSSCVTPAGCAYTFGGNVLANNETKRTDRLYKVWLCIPKLGEICWEAILHYAPKIASVDRSTLLAAGIPSNFLARLDG